MKILVIFFSLLGVVLTTKSYTGYDVLLVTPNSVEQVLFLKSLEHLDGIDFWDVIHKEQQSFRLMISPKLQSKVKKLLNKENIKFSTIIEDVQNTLNDEKLKKDASKQKRMNNERFDLNHFWELDEVNSYLQFLANAYPNLASLEIIGKSTEGRDILAIKISKNGTITDQNPIIIIEGTLHAREWIGTMVNIHIIRELVENNEVNSDLLNGLDWIIVPVVNVDGFVYTYRVDRFWRKTRSINPGSNCAGVDPNRNFAYKWEYATGTSEDPCSFVYRGRAANTEPEVASFSRLLSRYKSNRLFLAIHSYGNYLTYPWSYDYLLIDNLDEHKKLGERVRSAIYAVNQTKYTLGSTAVELSPASGCSDDFAAGIGRFNLTFVIELPGGGLQGFDLPAEKISSVLKETFPGIKEFAYFVLERYGQK